MNSPADIAVAALRKQAGFKRLKVDTAMEAVSDVADMKSAIEEVQNTDAGSLLDDLETYAESLETLRNDHGLGISEKDAEQFAGAVKVLRDLILDADLVEEFVGAYDEAEEAVQLCEQHRDAERGEYDTSEKDDARGEASDAMMRLAEAILALSIDEENGATE